MLLQISAVNLASTFCLLLSITNANDLNQCTQLIVKVKCDFLPSMQIEWFKTSQNKLKFNGLNHIWKCIPTLSVIRGYEPVT